MKARSALRVSHWSLAESGAPQMGVLKGPNAYLAEIHHNWTDRCLNHLKKQTLQTVFYCNCKGRSDRCQVWQLDSFPHSRVNKHLICLDLYFQVLLHLSLSARCHFFHKSLEEDLLRGKCYHSSQLLCASGWCCVFDYVLYIFICHSKGLCNFFVLESISSLISWPLVWQRQIVSPLIPNLNQEELHSCLLQSLGEVEVVLWTVSRIPQWPPIISSARF